MMKKAVKLKTSSKLRKAVLFIAGLCIAAYEVLVLIHRDFTTYLFLRLEFVFLDYSKSIWMFSLDYLSLMGTFVFAAHSLSKLFRKIRPGKEASK